MTATRETLEKTERAHYENSVICWCNPELFVQCPNGKGMLPIGRIDALQHPELEIIVSHRTVWRKYEG